MKNITQQDTIIVGGAALLFVLVALFTPIGAAFLTVIGIIAFVIYKTTQPKNS